MNWNPEAKGFVEVVIETPEGEETIKFSNYESFHKTLTPQRMQILSFLAKEEVNSINELAKILNRDPKSVRNDIGVLETIGLVKLETYINRKVPKAITKKMKIFIDLKSLSPFSEKKELSRERVEFGLQMLRQKYLPISIKCPDVKVKEVNFENHHSC